MIRSTILLLSLLLTQLTVSGQNGSALKQAYVDQYKLLAIENMHRTGVPASITLAQGLLESGVGQSPLAVEANNHFGIKCHKEWQGETFIMDDDTKDECFRKYTTVLESYLDHAEFLRSRARYGELFKLEITDYKGWARGLKAAGYATNPNYAPLLIKQIEELGLAEFDRVNPTQLAALKSKKVDAQAAAPAEVEITEPEQEQVLPVVPCKPGVFEYNKVKVICAEAGDSPMSIAETHGLYPWQVLKYNDLLDEVRFKQGELIYLEAKRNRAQVESHVVGVYESLRDISQRYGISIKGIRRKNQLRDEEEPAAGETLYLINKRADRPKVRSLADIETARSERDRKEAALRKPTSPPVVATKPLPTYAAPAVERDTTSLLEETKSAPIEIKLPEPKPVKVAPLPEPAERTPEDVKPNAGAKKHLVVKGDTLFNISRRYGLTVAELRALNNLEGVDIQLGMELIVSK